MSYSQSKNKAKLKLNIPMYNTNYSLGMTFQSKESNPLSQSTKVNSTNKFLSDNEINNSKGKDFYDMDNFNKTQIKVFKKKSMLPEMPLIYKNNTVKSKQGRPLSISKATYSPLTLETPIVSTNFSNLINKNNVPTKLKDDLYSKSNDDENEKKVHSGSDQMGLTVYGPNKGSKIIKLSPLSNTNKTSEKLEDSKYSNSQNNNKFNKTSNEKFIASNNQNLNNNLNNNSTSKISTPSTTKNQPVSIMSLFASNLPLDIKHLTSSFQYYDSSKYSAKSLGVVKSYSANTHQGIVRDYNEDRVSIILNIIKPSSYTGSFWPKCSFFGIYDGHGGNSCAEFLRDNLHHYVVRDENFPVNPIEALKQGFKSAENDFLTKHAYISGEIKERSGSCALVVLVVDDIIYIANCGDSRAILSKNKGKEIIQLSRDHKPDDPDETKRIVEAGGKIYQ